MGSGDAWAISRQTVLSLPECEHDSPESFLCDPPDVAKASQRKSCSANVFPQLAMLARPETVSAGGIGKPYA